MRKRSSNLLLTLLQPNKVISANKITQKYQISFSTLKNDLSEINDFLISNSAPTFYINEQGHIQATDLINNSVIKEKLYALNNYEYRCNQTERQLLVFAMLINKDHYTAMGLFAEKLFVSRITVLSDIEFLKERLSNYTGIFLISKSSKGMKLDVKNELSMRYLLIDILRDIVTRIDDENVFLQIFERELHIETSITKIVSIIGKYEVKHNILFSTETFYEIVLYLYITIYRYQKGHFLLNGIIQNNSSNISGHYDISLIIKNVFDELSIQLSIHELASISNGIMDRKFILNSQQIDDIELYKIVVYFLSKIAIKEDVSIDDDPLLIDSLVMHIKNQFYDTSSDIDFSFEQGFQEKYYDIFDDIENYSIILERYLQRSLSDKMKSSIFIHICAAIIRSKKCQTPLSVFVVCPGSMATGRLVEAQLSSYFNFNIKGVIGREQLSELIKNNNEQLDFIVSTVDIEINICPIIVVEPVLTVSDFDKIKQLALFINKNSKNKIKNTINILEPIKNISKKLAIEDRISFIADIQKVINNYSNMLKNSIGIFNILGGSSSIKIVENKIDWFKAIRLSGNILLKKNYISKEYIEEMIKNIKLYGPYIIVGSKIAIAHAKPKQYVYSEGLSLIISKKGIFFDEDEANTINFMFCFSTMGNLEYIELFWQIARLSNNHLFIKMLLNAKSPEEAYNIFWNVHTFSYQ